MVISCLQWSVKDAAEKEKRVALKTEKALVADRAKEFVHELDDIDKQVRSSSELCLSILIESA